MGNEKILRHPRLVETTFVVVVTVALDVLVVSVFSVRCVLVNANTGVSSTFAPETGHFSYFTDVSEISLRLLSEEV